MSARLRFDPPTSPPPPPLRRWRARSSRRPGASRRRLPPRTAFAIQSLTFTFLSHDQVEGAVFAAARSQSPPSSAQCQGTVGGWCEAYYGQVRLSVSGDGLDGQS